VPACCSGVFGFQKCSIRASVLEKVGAASHVDVADMRTLLIPMILLLYSTAAHAQKPDSSGLPRFQFEYSGLSINGTARPGMYLAAHGRAATILGDEDGSFDVWVWPQLLVRDLRLTFQIPNFDPIDGSTLARRVIRRPEAVTIVYSHALFTVREHVLVPLDAPGVIVLLEVETAISLDVLVRMQPNISIDPTNWVDEGGTTWLPGDRRFRLDDPRTKLNAYIGSPQAASGIARAAAGWTHFSVHVEPTLVSSYIPVIAAGGSMSRDSAAVIYDRLLGGFPGFRRTNVLHYRNVSDGLLSVETPDPQIATMLEWTKVNLDQQLVCFPGLGCGLVAGYQRAHPDFKPGYGWFFGGESAISTLGMSAIGQFDHVQQGLRLLARHQRTDGRIAYELPRDSARLPTLPDYPDDPLFGETTPYWLLACYEYWLASGDQAFLRELWPMMVKAFDWSAGTDVNGDGLMDTAAAGAGIQDAGVAKPEVLTGIYLAAVWTAALDGVAQMADALADGVTRARASQMAAKAQQSLENGFWVDGKGMYGRALLKPRIGSEYGVDEALSAWPAGAMAFGLVAAERADRMLEQIGSAQITADWGARGLSRVHPDYHPLSYSDGLVLPVVTGLVALAHYKSHRGWAGYDLVRDAARTAFDFTRGHTPGQLSGSFYQTLDWGATELSSGSAMFGFSFVRGTIGWQADAPHRAAAFEPHLPADWLTLKVENLRVGRDRIAASIAREPGLYTVHVRRLTRGAPISLRIAPALPLGARVERVVVNDRDVVVQAEENSHDVHGVAEITLVRDAEVEFHYTGGLEVVTPPESLSVGDASSALKVLDFRREGENYAIALEGLAGTKYTLQLRSESRLRSVLNADAFDQTADRINVRVSMPAGAGFVKKTLRVR
jgi:hypothetical protein